MRAIHPRKKNEEGDCYLVVCLFCLYRSWVDLLKMKLSYLQEEQDEQKKKEKTK